MKDYLVRFRRKDKDKELRKQRAYDLLREGNRGSAAHQPVIVREVIKEREVVVVNCRYCGSLMESTILQCPHCGARRQ